MSSWSGAVAIDIHVHADHSGRQRLDSIQPMLIGHVGVDFPGMTIISAHPSWPRTDEARSTVLLKAQRAHGPARLEHDIVPPQMVRYGNSQPEQKGLFSSDRPLISPDKGVAASLSAAPKLELLAPILKNDTVHLLSGERL